jgi:ferredoxin--NADP+ reductase
MVCGSLAFNLDIKALLERRACAKGRTASPAEFVVEKAFVGDGI